MSQALRRSEKWFQRGLWLVALVFAGFLTGLGGTIVGDLPKVEQRRNLDDFLDRAEAERLRALAKQGESAAKEAGLGLEQAQLRLNAATADTRAATDAFNAWLATRRATARSDKDDELEARTAEVERLRQAQRAAQAGVEAQQKALVDAQQSRSRVQGNKFCRGRLKAV